MVAWDGAHTGHTTGLPGACITFITQMEKNVQLNPHKCCYCQRCALTDRGAWRPAGSCLASYDAVASIHARPSLGHICATALSERPVAPRVIV